MKSRTITVSVAAPAAAVYAFASDPRNLPRWAPAAFKSAQYVDGNWVVHSQDGSTLTIEFAGQNPFGVLDHTVTVSPDVKIHVPMRVVANGAGSEILFTLFQYPNMDDQQFAEDAKLVERDLNTLKQLAEAAHGSPT